MRFVNLFPASLIQSWYHGKRASIHLIQTRTIGPQAMKLKLIVCPGSEVESADSVVITNKLAGLEYNHVSFDSDHLHTSLRILEFNWNTVDIELWNLCGASEYQFLLPTPCIMESSGLILVSNEAPVNFIEKNNGYFGSKDYPMMWFVNDHKYQSSPLEQALQPWNITKVYFSEPEDPIIPSEFNHWLSKVTNYLKRTGQIAA